MDETQLVNESTSDESSSIYLFNKKNQIKRSQSLKSFKLDSFRVNNVLSSLSGDESNRRRSNVKVKQKASHLYKYLKLTFTIIIVLLIVFQLFYNFFIYKNQLDFGYISQLGVEKLFQSKLHGDILVIDKANYFNRTLLINLNRTTLSPEEFQKKLITDENNQIFEEELTAFKLIISETFLQADIPIQHCSKVPHTLQGHLDSNLILKQANLSNLIQFYDFKNKIKTIEQNKKRLDKIDNKKEKQIIFRDLFYLNGSENAGNDSNTNEEDWLLWNTNNMTGLLNLTNSYFGNDGKRVELGGHWTPKDCISNFKVAIIIPYRDRLPHLKVLLYYLHMVLQRQMLNYRIFVVEPTSPPEVRFNKGRVMNAAFLEALKIDPTIDCFVFHDVDLIPEDDRTMYSCPPKPRHLSAAIDKFDYILPYNYLVGGVFVIRTKTYREINGYSNLYWGWGAEDDDLSVRIRSHKLDIIRHPTKLARYKMIRHKQQKLNPNAHENLKKANSRHKKDGVNTIKYEVVKKTLFTGFTHFLFDIGTFNA